MHLHYRVVGLDTGKTGDGGDVVETALSNFPGTCYIVHFKKIEMVAETTKTVITIMGTARARANSKESATIAEKLGTKKPIAGTSILRKSQPNTVNWEKIWGERQDPSSERGSSTGGE